MTIITVSREFGSGGREFAKSLAEELQFTYYDKEIIRAVAEEMNLDPGYIDSIMEHMPGIGLIPLNIGRSFAATALDAQTHYFDNDRVYGEQTKVIHELSQRGPCVFVGRCSDYILRDRNVLRIFVYADMPAKVARCRERSAENENFTDRLLAKKIKDVDSNRMRYYQYFTDQKWGNPLNYDLCLNTSGKDIKTLAKTVAVLVKEREKLQG